jgi:hypothetical protein
LSATVNLQLAKVNVVLLDIEVQWITAMQKNISFQILYYFRLETTFGNKEE